MGEINTPEGFYALGIDNYKRGNFLAAKEAFNGNTLGSNLPKVKIKSDKINKNFNIIDLVLLSKLENSKSEIRRLIKGNAIKINDEIISDEKLIINHDFFKEDYLKLSIGKKRHLKIVIS